MKKTLLILLTLLLNVQQVFADEYQATIKSFKSAESTHSFFDQAYGYAVFPTIGKGGFGIGGAYGTGKVYQKGQYIGDTSMAQVTVGLQFGGQAYTQIIFFQDKRALDEFTSGNFEFSAQATAIAITAGASAEVGSKGASAGASGGKNNLAAEAKYYKGMVTFVVAKGGLMYEASLGGQKFSFEPKK